MLRPAGLEKYAEALYLIYFVLMLVARALGMYEGTIPYTAVLVIAMILFAVKMIITSHTVKEYGIAAVLLAVAVLVYLHTGEKGLIVCFTMMLGMKEVNKYKVFKFATVTSAVCVIFRIITGVFGILPEKYYPQLRDGAGLMFRHALGYVHPNTLHINVLMLTMLIGFTLTSVFVHLRESEEGSGESIGSKYTLYLAIISALLFAFNLYVFVYSGSRTGLLTSFVYLAFNLWFFVRRRPEVFEKTICFAAYPGVCLIALALPFVFTGSLFERIDRTIFNTRLLIARYFWSNNSLSLWGIRLNNPDPQYRTYGIDMAQLYLFLQLGIVAFILISAITLAYVHFALKRHLMAELAVLMGILFAGIWEPFLYNSGFKNFTFVFMGAMLYELLEDAAGQNDETRDKVVHEVTVESEASTIKEIKLPPIKTVLVCILSGAIIGGMASAVYAVSAPIPTALYADRQEDEAGDEFGMEPLYLTKSDVDALDARGDLIVGYLDENTPMYMYDTSIAVMEYNKKVLSIGVWSGISVMCICMIYFAVKYNKHSLSDG